MSEPFTVAPDWQDRLQVFMRRGSVKFSNHDNPKQGTCIMEAVAYIAGDEHSDMPKCTALSLTSVAVWLNDTIGRDDGCSTRATKVRNKLLKPLISDLINTSSLKQREMHRDEYGDLEGRYPSVEDEHDEKVAAYLKAKIRERFNPLTTCNEPVVMLQSVYDAPTCNRNAFFGQVAEILRDGARYAKQLLGEDVNAPVTIYASENMRPGCGDKYVNDMPVIDTAEDHQHEEIHV